MTSEERQHILQMLQDGRITAQQAFNLMQTLEGNPLPDTEPDVMETEGQASQPLPDEPITGTILPPVNPPDMTRYRRFWQIPFFIALAFMATTGLILRSIYQNSDGALSLGFACFLSLFIFATGLTALTLLTRRAAWIHVRVKERSGRRIAISLPLPLSIAHLGITLAKGFVPDAERSQLEMADEFISEAKTNFRDPGSEPLMLHIDDEDGDRVELFIG